MKIALIGGAGLIGHNIALRMKKKGHDVLIVDPLTVNNKYALMGNPIYSAMIDERLALLSHAKIPIMHVDARDYHQLCNVVGPWKPDSIVHLAAIAHIDRSNKDPFSTFDHNLRTLENTLDLGRSLKNVHVVYFSSSTAYGDFKSPTIDETEHCDPKGIYGSLKYAGELMVKAHADTYGMATTIIRPCALYGPRCVSGRVTQKFVERAIKGLPITIDGDGSARNDFTYITDLVDGVEKALTLDTAKGETFNITTGEARTLKELADIVKSHFPDLVVNYGPADPEKPSRGTMSVTKAQLLLGYRTKYSLERGMAEYIAWNKAFFGRQAAA
jgi:nucleoside-diphosphate-sugar epimerase